MARVTLNSIDEKYNNLVTEIRKEINKKFGHCRRMIGKAKWKGNFSSSRGKGETFGKWNNR